MRYWNEDEYAEPKPDKMEGIDFESIAIYMLLYEIVDIYNCKPVKDLDARVTALAKGEKTRALVLKGEKNVYFVKLKNGGYDVEFR